MEISESYDIVTKVKECIYQYNILLRLNSEFSDEDQLKMCNSIFYIAGSIKKVCEYAVDTNSILICKRIIRYLHPEIEDLLKSWMDNKGKFMDAEKQLTFFADISAIKANIRMVREYLESVQPEEKNNSKNVNEIPKKEDEKPEEKTVYTPELLKLFKNRAELIDELIGKSDKEIAALIKKWAGEKDKLGKPLIENPYNNLKTAFAESLKENRIIKLSKRSFRNKL